LVIWEAVVVKNSWAGVVLTVATVAAAAAVIVAAIRYPPAVAPTDMVVVLSISAALLAGNLGYAASLSRRAPVGLGAGVWFGVAASLCWAAEIWAGGPALLSRSAERATGGTFALAATAITVAAGIAAGSLAARDTGAARVWHVGILAGAISGALVYAYAVTMTLTSLMVLGGRADYQAQFADSRLPTMADFLVNDILSAGAAHLIINLGLGILGAAVGRLAFALRRPRTVSDSPAV
jgi:hypothetical protein